MVEGKEQKIILLISPESWGDNMLSKHHYAIELAKLGHKVYFLNPAGTRNVALKVNSNLEIIDYKPIKGANRLPKSIARLLQSFEIKTILKKMAQHPDIVWSFDPHRLQWLSDFKAEVTIYHAIDNHFTPKEKVIQKEADFVFSYSERILQKFTNTHKYLIGHGLASEFLNPRFTEVSLPGRNKIKVGYVGNLANALIDFEELERVIIDNPMIDFYFIGPKGKSNLSGDVGPIRLEKALKSNANMYYLGQQKPSEIPSYLRKLDLLMLVYKSDKSGFVVNPHKLLEYLSSGKPIVATLMSETLPELDELIEIVPESRFFSNHFARGLKNLKKHESEDKVSRRKAIASNNSYSKRVKEIFTIIQKA